MTELSLPVGFTNRQEAIAHKNLMQDALMVTVVHMGGFPVTPIAYLSINQEMIDKLQAKLKESKKVAEKQQK